MFSLIIWILYLVMATRCSFVIEKANQHGIYMKDYCPKMDACPEGSHVLCLYYDPEHVMGPRCDKNGQNISITEEHVTLILDYINKYRDVLAQGTEVGKDNQPLPKAYGMFKLEWDKELATMAQVWANQCTLSHDLCRATKKFSNPSQVVGIIHFKHPSWDYTGDAPAGAPKEKEGVLSDTKLRYSIVSTLRNSYETKKLVTSEMINHFPDLNNRKDLAAAKIYLRMIHGNTTHVGCGISSYFIYHGDVDSGPLVFNGVEIVCNFAGQATVGEKVYETDPPQKEGWTVACGCPPGYDEDENCLCIKSEREESITSPKSETRTCDIGDSRCEPSVVLLPIFTVEDAPPDKLYHPSLRNASRRDDSFEIFDILHPKATRLFPTVKRKLQNKQSSYLIASPPARRQLNKRISKIDSKPFKDVKNRYFNKNAVIPAQKYQNFGSLNRRAGQQNRIPPFTKKNSIFTRASKFQLPSQNDYRGAYANTTIKRKLNPIKKDVIPRKDFSKVQGLMSAYLSKKHNDNAKKQSVTTKYEQHVENLLASVVPKQQKFGIKDFNSTAPYKKFDLKSSNEETDTKLLSLLDNLEQEVKHVDLNSNVKEIFDAKIRKIYGNVVGDSETNKKAQPLEIDELLDRIDKKTNLPSNDDANRAIDIQTHNFESARPLKRSQNSIVQYDKPSYERYRSKYSIFDKEDRDTSYGSDTGKHNIQRDVKTDNSFKDSHNYNNNDNRQSSFKNMEKVKLRNYYLNDEDDPLGAERRKYYQDKLDNMERRLQTARGYRHRNEVKDNSRLVRPVLNPRNDLEQTRPVNHPQGFYLPDRAKFLHGF